MDVLLDVRDLQTQFATSGGIVRAVDGVSWDVQAGETVALVGEGASCVGPVAREVAKLMDADRRKCQQPAAPHHLLGLPGHRVSGLYARAR